MYSTIYILTNNYYYVWYWYILFNGGIIAEGYSDTLPSAEFAANWKIAVHRTALLAG